MAEAGGQPQTGGTHSKRGKWRRRLGVVLIVISVAALVAVGVAAGLYFSFSASVHSANKKIDADIQQALDTPPPTTLVTVPSAAGSGSEPGDAQQDAVMNMLVLGTDARPGEVEGPGSTDVVMLLHIDPKLDYLSILSITRDLYLDIPGYGMDRINSAYYRGGPALTIATLKQALGIDVTEYLGVGFESFPGLIDSLGGVYVDVDRKYTDTPTWKFDLSPGYQWLDGATALLFSRYRFDDNGDFGRMYRQQRILAGLRVQAQGWDKKLKLPGMVNTLMRSAATNLSANEMLKLASWLVQLDGSRIKQIIVKGPGKMIDGKAVVVVDQATLTQAATDFFTPPPSEAGQPPSAGARPERAAATSGPLLVAADSDALRLALAAPATTGTAPAAVSAATATAAAAAALLDAGIWQTAQQTVPFALRGPTYLPDGFAYAEQGPRGGRDLRDQGGRWDQACGSRGIPVREERPLPGHLGDDLDRGSAGERWHGDRKQRRRLHGRRDAR